MARPLVSDELWSVVEPLLPPLVSSPKGGRPPISNRAALTGILFVLKTGIPWEDLPQEMGCGCGMTCWRRLRDWHQAGVWEQLHLLLLDGLQGADALDWSRALVDSSSVRAVGAGQKPAPIPRIAGGRAANTTWSPTLKVCRSRATSPEPIATTSLS